MPIETISLKLSSTQMLSYIDLIINFKHKIKFIDNLIYYFCLRKIKLDYLNTILNTRILNKKFINLGNSIGKGLCSDINHFCFYNSVPNLVFRCEKRRPTAFFYKCVKSKVCLFKSFDKEPEIKLKASDNQPDTKVAFLKEKGIIFEDKKFSRKLGSCYEKAEEIEYSPLAAVSETFLKRVKETGNLRRNEEVGWTPPDFYGQEKEKEIDKKILYGRLKGIISYKNKLISDEDVPTYEKRIKELNEISEKNKKNSIVMPCITAMRSKENDLIIKKYNDYMEFTKQLDNDKKFFGFYRKYTKTMEDAIKYRDWFEEATVKNPGALLEFIPKMDHVEALPEPARAKVYDALLDDLPFHVWGDHYIKYAKIVKSINDYKRENVLCSYGDDPKVVSSGLSKEQSAELEDLKLKISRKKRTSSLLKEEEELKSRIASHKGTGEIHKRRAKSKKKTINKSYVVHKMEDVIKVDNYFEVLAEKEEEIEITPPYSDVLPEWDEISDTTSSVRVYKSVIPKNEDFLDAIKIFETVDNFELIFKKDLKGAEEEIRENPGLNKIPRSRGRYYLILVAKLLRLLKEGKYKKNIDKDVHIVRGCSIKYIAGNMKRLIESNKEILKIDLKGNKNENKFLFL